jgi:hypothetical protein
MAVVKARRLSEENEVRSSWSLSLHVVGLVCFDVKDLLRSPVHVLGRGVDELIRQSRSNSFKNRSQLLKC